MKKKRFSEEQIVNALKAHAGGMSVRELCRRYGCSETAFYKWQSLYSGLNAADIREYRRAKAENVRLKKLLAQAQEDKAVLKELLEKLS